MRTPRGFRPAPLIATSAFLTGLLSNVVTTILIVDSLPRTATPCGFTFIREDMRTICAAV